MTTPAVPDQVQVPAAGSSSGLGRATALMASGTIVSRILGILRTAVLVWAISMGGPAANTFAAANKLPNMFYLLVAAGVLNAVLVPQVVRAYRRADGQEYVDRLLTIGIVILVGVTAVLTLAAPFLIWLYSRFGDPELTALAVLFAYWCIPQMFFYGLYSLLGQVLNARGSFGPYMWAPVVNNLVTMAGLGVFIAVNGAWDGAGSPVDDPAWWGGPQVALLAGTFTLGIVAQALVLVVPLYRGGFRYRPRWGFRGVGLRSAGRVATWTFLGLLVGQIGILVVSNVTTAASTSGGTGNAVYDQAFMIFMLPHSVVTVSLMTALFTRLAARAAADDVDAVRADLSLGLRVVGLFSLLATALLVVLAYPLGRALFFSAKPDDLASLAPIVVAMALGLPAFGAWSLAQRVYYAYEDARSMFPIQIVMVGIVIGGTLLGWWLLPASSWTVAAAGSMSTSYVVGAALALTAVHGRLRGIDGPRVAQTHVKAVLAAVLAGIAGAVTVHALAPVGDWSDGVVTCLVGGAVITVAYVALLRLMRVRELGVVTRMVGGRVLGRRSGRRG